MSLEESLRDVERQVAPNTSYFTLMASSGVLAAVSFLTNSVPILVGAMVVAPALPPLELVALAIVYRRRDLTARGVWVAIVGLIVAMVGAMAATWILNVTNVIPPETNLLNKPLLEERVNPGWYSVVAAVAAGTAGALGTTEQRTDTLVGVVASVALVPAVAAAGIAFLSRDPTRGWGGIVLTSINVVLIVLTAIMVLLIIRSDWGPDP